MKLWGRDKETNLRKFDELWEEKRQGKSKELASKEQNETDLWREIFHNKLENEPEFIRHKATERGFETNVHVPLGLLERKQQQRRDKTSSPNNPYELEKEVIVKTYEHDAFLQEVIGLQSAENKKHIGIIGEAGAGKTTLLIKVAEYLKNETEYLPVWISLADLQGETLENYLLDTWFSSIECSKKPEQLKQRFSQADIWLLLDGVDEMAENSPLDTLKIDKLPDWLRKARFVLTCRLNVWDERINNPLTGFETYKTQEFKPKQVDDFIQDWFKYAEKTEKGSIEKGTALQTKLKETRHEKIRSLVTNPLRLSLLCQTFYLDKQGELPETKAGLYERFTNYFYEWKPEKIPEELRYSDKKKEELHQALSKLALAGIDSNARFRLNRKVARKQMGEELFKFACDVGWLNLVDRDAKTDKGVYAFFHANFQEYFAALAIDDWDYFLPREHDNKPVVDRYRIFEPQWKEVILLWLGRDEDDVSDVEKEEFIKALVEFDDGCGEAKFYHFQTYFLAAAGIAEYKNCSKADEIVFQIVKWAFGYFNYKENRWQHFVPLNKKAYRLLKYTLHDQVIICLIQFLKTITDDKTYASVAAKNGSENAQIIILQIALTLLDFSSENLEAKKAIKAIVDNSNNRTDIAFDLKHLELSVQIQALKSHAFWWISQNERQEQLLLNQNHQENSIQQDRINLEEEIPHLILSLDASDQYLFHSERLKRLVTNNHEAVSPIVKFIYKLLSEKHKDIYLHLFDCLNCIARIGSNSQEIIDCLIEVITNYSGGGNHNIKRKAIFILSVLSAGNQQVLNFITNLIQNDKEIFIKVEAIVSLNNILQRDMYVSAAKFLSRYILEDVTQESRALYFECYWTLFFCAQNMTYPDFYQAWNQQNN